MKADHHGKIPAVAFGIEKCSSVVLARQLGEVLQVVLKSENGAPTWAFEIESDGRAVYEFDVQRASGPDMRVEVDAASGHVVESSTELLEIGRL